MKKQNLVLFPGIQQTSAMREAVRGSRTAAKLHAWGAAVAAKKWTLLIAAVGLLLGRAVILETLTPFAAAYFAVILFTRRSAAVPAALALTAGSLLAVHPPTPWIVMQLAVLYLLVRGLEAYERSELAYAPLLVFMTAFLTGLFEAVIGDRLGWYELTMAAVEGALAFMLTLVFLQALPVLTLAKKSAGLKNEEVICLVILLAAVMTGTVGWSAWGLSVEHVLSRYLLLLFALAGGAPLGASVGVTGGLVLSLADYGAVAQLGLLAFAGLLAGLLREGGRLASAFGLLLGTAILAVFSPGGIDAVQSTWESGAAAVLLLLTPRSLLRTVARYVPGTSEHLRTQHEYARRVRDATAQRVAQFSEVFRQLAKSFGQQLAESDAAAGPDKQAEHFMNAVAERACSTCYRKDMCWDGKFYQTYKVMTEMMSAIENDRKPGARDIPKEWSAACVRPHQVLAVMHKQYELFRYDLHWQKQIQESRRFVADQLSGVSQIMDDLAREIRREGQALHLQEQQIREAIEGLGLSIQGVDIVSLEEGSVEIEITHTFQRGFDECRKIVAPLLTDILGETIAVKSERHPPGGGAVEVVLGSAKAYEVETGVAGAAKGGGALSGDSFSMLELKTGKYAVAVSDGMGGGERARLESSAALTILEQLLQSGMDEKLAIKSVNSVLVLRSQDEVFATVDVALIDMYTARTTFVKIGSTPSFIKRGGEVITVSANNLPVGILRDIDVDLIRVQLQPGDTLIMMTDGVFDAPGHAVNKELWMKRVIQDIRAEEPQALADELLETVQRCHGGDIQDDMTIVVTKVDKYQPEWAAFRWPGLGRLDRPRTVS